MKKKRYIVALMLSLVAAVFFWLNSDGAPNCDRGIPIDGAEKIPAKDLSAIKRVVHRKLRGEILTNISWASIKELPASIKNYSGIRIAHVEVDVHDDAISAWVADGTNDYANEIYFITKKGGRWHILP